MTYKIVLTPNTKHWAKLVEKDADYTAVEAALAKVPTDLSIYTEATAKAVEEAGWRLDISAPNPQTPSITAAIDLFFKENKVNKK